MRIWITGGGTREPIDAVRYLGNQSTGRLSLALAREALGRGHSLRLFLAGEVDVGDLEAHGSALELSRYVTALELQEQLLEGRAAAPDAVFHAAAVADYAPRPEAGKVASGKGSWTLELRPLPKIAPQVKRAWPRCLLFLFKLEAGVSREELVARALRAARRARADFVFANALAEVGQDHRGVLLDAEGGGEVELRGREDIARGLLDAAENAAREGSAARS